MTFKPYITQEIELDDETSEKIMEMSKEFNMSENELIVNMLQDSISKVITKEDFRRLSYDEMSDFWIVTDNDMPLFRVTPISG